MAEDANEPNWITRLENHTAQLTSHRLENWVFQNKDDRQNIKGLSYYDIGKIAFQLDNTTYWRLDAVAPQVVWYPIGGLGAVPGDSDSRFGIIRYHAGAVFVYAYSLSGLSDANAAAVSGDTIYIPTGSITMPDAMTVASGVEWVGGYNTVLTGNITNNGTIRQIDISGTLTNASFASDVSCTTYTTSGSSHIGINIQEGATSRLYVNNYTNIYAFSSTIFHNALHSQFTYGGNTMFAVNQEYIKMNRKWIPDEYSLKSSNFYLHLENKLFILVSGATTVTLATSIIVQFYIIKNIGNDIVTLAGSGTTIDGQSSIQLQPGDSMGLLVQGASPPYTTWYSIQGSTLAAYQDNIFAGDNTLTGINTFTLPILSPGMFADIYASNNTAAHAVPNTTGYTKVNVWNVNGVNNSCTPDHTNDKITLHHPGHYKVACNMSFQSSLSDIQLNGAAFLAGVEQSQIHFIKSVVATNYPDAVVATGLLVCNTADLDLDFRYKHDNASPVNITTIHGNMSVQYVGEP